MTQKKFSKAVAAVLKANFPELGTQREMEGADTVDALNSLYSLAKRGSPLRGGPPADPDENPPNSRTLAGRVTRLLNGGGE
jgi:hypothetical protein